jgi:hypothetical protein
MKKKPEWVEGSFLDNFNQAATMLGYQYIPLAWGLASVNWESTKDRDSFLENLVRPEMVTE